MGGMGMRELVIILLVVLVVFGTKKLRTIGSDLGSAVRGFKKAMNEGEQEELNPSRQLRADGQRDAEFPEAGRGTTEPKAPGSGQSPGQSQA